MVHAWIRRLVLRVLALSIFSLCSAAPGARAEDAASAEQADRAARAAFEAGRNAYDEGRFGEALAHYDYAYELSHRPALLFNIARAAEADGQSAKAISAYEAYLEANQAADNRAFVEARLVKLREHGAARSPAPASVGPGAAAATLASTSPSPNGVALRTHDGSREPERASRPLWRRRWFWGACGAVVLGAVVAGIVVAARPDERQRADADERIMALVQR